PRPRSPRRTHGCSRVPPRDCRSPKHPAISCQKLLPRNLAPQLPLVRREPRTRLNPRPARPQGPLPRPSPAIPACRPAPPPSPPARRPAPAPAPVPAPAPGNVVVVTTSTQICRDCGNHDIQVGSDLPEAEIRQRREPLPTATRQSYITGRPTPATASWGDY